MAMAAAAYLLILLVAAPAAHAAQHVVGGDTNGWSQSTDLTTWASGETFTVGDSLVFNYDGTHGVDEVSKSDYDNCNTGSALKSYSNGKTTINLDTAGPMYFICPSMGHCQGGMKLAITVTAASTTPSTGTPPATGTPTTPSGSSPPTTPSPSTPGSTTTPTPTTTTPNGGAAGNFGSMNFVMLGFSLVVYVGLASFMG